jgi:hypothetical protein
MVFKMHAGDLDLHDRGLTRRQSRQRLDSQIHRRHILPAISVNKLSKFGVRWHSEVTTAPWIAFLRTEASNFPSSISKAPSLLRPAGAFQKKENQCQES